MTQDERQRCELGRRHTLVRIEWPVDRRAFQRALDQLHGRDRGHTDRFERGSIAGDCTLDRRLCADDRDGIVVASASRVDQILDEDPRPRRNTRGRDPARADHQHAVGLSGEEG
jgi:hypothetical protein